MAKLKNVHVNETGLRVGRINDGEKLTLVIG